MAKIENILPAGRTMNDLNEVIKNNLHLLELIEERFRDKDESEVIKYAGYMKQTIFNIWASVTAVAQDRIKTISTGQKQGLAFLENIEQQRNKIPPEMSEDWRRSLEASILAEEVLIHKAIKAQTTIAQFHEFEIKTSYLMLFAISVKLNEILSRMTTNEEKYENIRKELLNDIAAMIPLLGQLIWIVKWLTLTKELLETEIQSFEQLDEIAAFKKEAHHWLSYTVEFNDFFIGLLNKAEKV